jgi:general secretion pathway protein G
MYQRRPKIDGWTLLELLAVIAISSVLATVAYGSYSGAVQRAKIAQATVDIAKIHAGIEKYRLNHGDELPDSLAEIGLDLKDPWGAPYAYLNFDTLPGNSKGPVRKDHNLVPLNSRYDLYSKGPDGESRAPLTAQASRDDIVLANDGAFIGPASEY